MSLARAASRVAVLVTALAVARPGPASAQLTLEGIRSQGFVRCGSVQRPGLAQRDGAGRWSGLHVEICRAVAAALLGHGAAIAFHAYESERSFDGVLDGSDQIAFLSLAEIAEHGLRDRLEPGPPVFVESYDLLVANGSPPRHAQQLAGKPICFIIGTPANDSLETWFGTRHIPIVRYAFRETDEMNDAYAVQRCAALVGETTTLATVRREGSVDHLASRLLPEHLASFPIGAATPVDADTRWTALVAATIAALQAAEPPQRGGRAAGDGLPAIEGADISPDWRRAVLATTGDYRAIFDRTVGSGSPLALERGAIGPAMGIEP